MDCLVFSAQNCSERQEEEARHSLSRLRMLVPAGEGCTLLLDPGRLCWTGEPVIHFSTRSLKCTPCVRHHAWGGELGSEEDKVLLSEEAIISGWTKPGVGSTRMGVQAPWGEVNPEHSTQ